MGFGALRADDSRGGPVEKRREPADTAGANSREAGHGNDGMDVILQYSEMVYRMAYSLVKNKYDAEDIHQEVFVKYLKKRPVFESEAHRRAWFLRVTINSCKNLWKTAWKQKVVSLGEEDWDRTEDGQAAGEADGQREAVIALVKQLPKKYRIVIHLFYYEEMSTEEIAGVLGMKASAVRTQLARARTKLKELWKKQERSEFDNEREDR